MRCSACEAETPPTAKFCGNCGAPLAVACARCGYRNQPTMRLIAGIQHPGLRAGLEGSPLTREIRSFVGPLTG